MSRPDEFEEFCEDNGGDFEDVGFGHERYKCSFGDDSMILTETKWTDYRFEYIVGHPGSTRMVFSVEDSEDVSFRDFAVRLPDDATIRLSPPTNV